LSYVRYLDDFPIYEINNIWLDVKFSSRSEEKSYIVQTSARTVERCILMATDPGDLVLDPTCGSGTTAHVAEQWGRRWITLDTSRVALALARTRLTVARHPSYMLRDSEEGARKEAELSGHPPAAGPFIGDVRQGFVLERVPHVTLKSIANNAEIDIIHAKWQPALDEALTGLNTELGRSYEEWQVPRALPEGASDKAQAALPAFWAARHECQKEIDTSIARHADIEYLYDRPYTKRSTVRVTGPFTVESLSPHRVLPTGEDDEALLAAIEKETGEATPPRRPLRIPESQTDFATTVLENLRASGVQNTRKNERLTFATLKPWPGSALISAEGEYEENGQRKRAAIVIGPEYGTVGADLVREAAREARDLFDTLVICGFAFDPHVGEGTMALGRLTVLKARMNQELHTAASYKAGGGNLFTVFGEPDIALHSDPDDNYRVEIRGVDIFDPTSGEVRSSGDVKQDIACWFIDTDYDGDSFFVRHAYFLGGKDPFERLKTALRAEIDEDAWATLYRTESRPFPQPQSGRIAVKVINHHGDEAMRVFPVR
jgi:adenine-specific DNA-methyltransferase